MLTPLSAAIATTAMVWWLFTRPAVVRGKPREITDGARWSRRLRSPLALLAGFTGRPRVRRLMAGVGPAESRLLELECVAFPGVRSRLREWRGLQLACATLCGLLAMRALGGGSPVAALLPVAAAAWGGAMLPVVWLRRRGDRRLADLRAVLPDGLELVRACAASGLPLRRALTATARHCREPLAGELRALAAETSVGVPLLKAIENLARRNPLPEVRALAVALRQAERQGAPLANVLGAIADDARRLRERSIADRAAAAAPQIQLVVAVLLVPAALLELMALLIAAFARGEIRLMG